MKKTRRFVALLLAAVLALALFTACGAAGAEEPQSAIGKVYEDWFVEQINSNRPADKPVQKVDVKRSEMRAALAKISEDGKFTAGDGYCRDDHGLEESWHWLILTKNYPGAYSKDAIIKAVALTPENLTQYGPDYYFNDTQLYRINEYDIVTRVMDGKTYAAVYVHFEKKPS